MKKVRFYENIMPFVPFITDSWRRCVLNKAYLFWHIIRNFEVQKEKVQNFFSVHDGDTLNSNSARGTVNEIAN